MMGMLNDVFIAREYWLSMVVVMRPQPSVGIVC